jgi:hypothetical protein
VQLQQQRVLLQLCHIAAQHLRRHPPFYALALVGEREPHSLAGLYWRRGNLRRELGARGPAQQQHERQQASPRRGTSRHA